MATQITPTQQAALDHAKARWCLDDVTLVLEVVENCSTPEEAIDAIDEMALDYGLIDPKTY